MARVLNMPGAPAAVPTLDELAADLARASALPAHVAEALHTKCLLVLNALWGRQLATRAAADNVHLEKAEARPQSPYMNAEEGARYLRIKESRLDRLRREGCVPAVRDGKEFTYRREDLNQLREKIAQANQIIPRGFLTSLGPPKKRRTRRTR